MISKEKPVNFKKRFDIVGCFIEHDGKFLLLHRQAHKAKGDIWGLPAGKKEGDENIKQAVLREVKEETGITLNEQNVKYFDSWYLRDGDFDIEWHMFSTRLDELPSITLSPQEHSEYHWISATEALQMPLIHDLPELIEIFYKK